jgi:hypothetical protein
MSTNSKARVCTGGCCNKKHNPLVKSHTEENCWAIYPEKKEKFMQHNTVAAPSSSSSPSQHQVPAFAAITTTQCFLTGLLNVPAVLDSGASHHMFNDLAYFLDPAVCSIPISTGRNSTDLTAIRSGMALISQSDGRTLELSDALFVPGLSRNLLSLTQLVKQSASITRLAHHVCVVIDNDIIFDCKDNNNILEVQGAIGPVAREVNALVTTTHSLSTSAFETWHH